jgi:hypothetical protein
MAAIAEEPGDIIEVSYLAQSWAINITKYK